MLEHGQWHPQRSSEILECFIVSSVVKDCLALSQYDLHHGSFLLVTPIVMSSYKSTIALCALLSKFGILVKTLDRIYLTDASILLTLLLRQENNNVERLISLLLQHILKQSHRRSSFCRGSPQSLLRPLIQYIFLRQ